VFCRHCEERSDEAIHSSFAAAWIASRSLSSGAHSCDPLARNDGFKADATLSAVIARAGGRSSTPEALMIESKSRGVLDTACAGYDDL
jgi:hypothetical protein